MLNKTMRILSILLVVVVILSSVSMVSADYLNNGYSNTVEGKHSNAADAVGNVMQNVLGIVQVVGIVIAVIMLIVLAIKYISSAPNDKAEIKKHAVVYVVGAVLLFASVGVLELLKQFAGLFNQGVTGGSGSGSNATP